MKIALPGDVAPLRPTVQSVLGSKASLLIGSLLFGALFTGLTVYQLSHAYYLQGAGSLVLLGLVAYALFAGLRDAATGRELPPRRRIDHWVPPRSPAVIVLMSACVLFTVAGWMLPHHWYLEEGTVGRIGVWQHHEWWRLATSAFLHGNSTHLYFNMLALWILGREIDSTLGTPRFLAVYFGAALGGGLMVVAAGQEHTLGASGAIYGLMGAALYFGCHAFKSGHRTAAKRMLTTTGALIGLNLLLTFSIPNVSMAAHVGGLIAGFLVAMAVGFPRKLGDAWALSDRCPAPASFTYDVNADRFSYHGPAAFALESGLVDPDATAATKEDGWSPYIDVSGVDPRTPIDAYVDDPYVLLRR